MAWPDLFRVPATAYRAFIQNIWPAALLVFAAKLRSRKPNAYRVSLWIAVPFLCFALTRAMLAVAWSEDYRPFVPLNSWLESHSTQLICVGLGLVVLFCFRLHRVAGVLSGISAVVAILAFYWPSKPIARGAQMSVDGHPMFTEYINADANYSTTMFVPHLPDPVVLPAFVIAAFALISFLLVFLHEWRRLNLWFVISILLLTVPAVFLLGVLEGEWSIWISLPFINCMTVCSGLGLMGVCRYCVRESLPYRSRE